MKHSKKSTANDPIDDPTTAPAITFPLCCVLHTPSADDCTVDAASVAEAEVEIAEPLPTPDVGSVLLGLPRDRASKKS